MADEPLNETALAASGKPIWKSVSAKARRKAERQADAAESDRIGQIRAYVRGRERGRCRCCRFRAGQSMHELRPRSLGGKVSKSNSVWVCGDGVRGCHGLLQRKEILVTGVNTLMAEAPLYFMPMSAAAKDWTRLGQRHGIESPLMRDMEED